MSRVEKRPIDYIKSFVVIFPVVLIAIVIFLIIFITHFLQIISSQECIDDVATNGVITVLGGVRIKCQVLSPIQIASWYASWATVLVIIFLISAFIIQSIQLTNQRAEFKLSQAENSKMFAEQRNWEKSKLLLETMVEFKKTSYKYLTAPPSVLKTTLPPHLESINNLSRFVSALNAVKREDFLATQHTRETILGDKIKFKTYLELVCNLLSVDAVLENTPLNEADRDQLALCLKSLSVT